jgi:hypothetical protein
MAHRLQLIGEDLAGFMPLVESKKPKVMGVLTQLTLEYLQAEADVKVMSLD